MFDDDDEEDEDPDDDVSPAESSNKDRGPPPSNLKRTLKALTKNRRAEVKKMLKRLGSAKPKAKKAAKPKAMKTPRQKKATGDGDEGPRSPEALTGAKKKARTPRSQVKINSRTARNSVDDPDPNVDNTMEEINDSLLSRRHGASKKKKKGEDDGDEGQGGDFKQLDGDQVNKVLRHYGIMKKLIGDDDTIKASERAGGLKVFDVLIDLIE